MTQPEIKRNSRSDKSACFSSGDRSGAFTSPAIEPRHRHHNVRHVTHSFHFRDHTIVSVALGTGLRLAETSRSMSATRSRQTGRPGCVCVMQRRGVPNNGTGLSTAPKVGFRPMAGAVQCSGPKTRRPSRNGLPSPGKPCDPPLGLHYFFAYFAFLDGTFATRGLRGTFLRRSHSAASTLLRHFQLTSSFTQTPTTARAPAGLFRRRNRTRNLRYDRQPDMTHASCPTV